MFLIKKLWCRCICFILSVCLIIQPWFFVDNSYAALSILSGKTQPHQLCQAVLVGQPPLSKNMHYVGNLYERDLENGRQSNHIYLNNARVVVKEGGEVFYYHRDHLGNTNVITDESGHVREILEYAPFGETTRHDTPGVTPENSHYYNGKEEDEESGLYFYEARYYDPLVGRFITADTIVQSPLNNPQTLNRYAYTSNNPINRIDLDGHSWLKDIFKGIEKFINSGIEWLEKVTNSDWIVDVEVGQTHEFQDAETLAKGTGQVSLAILTQPWQAGIGLARWAHDPRFMILKNSSFGVYENSRIEDYDTVFVNGILNDVQDAFQHAEDAHGYQYNSLKVAYNPTDGPLADVTEAVLQKFFFTSSVDRQLASALSGHKGIVLSGHSQGGIVIGNTLLNLGLTGQRGVVTDAIFHNTQISPQRAYLSAGLAGVKMNQNHITYGSRYFDPSNIGGPNISEPLKILSGIPGLYLPFGSKHHGIE